MERLDNGSKINYHYLPIIIAIIYFETNKQLEGGDQLFFSFHNSSELYRSGEVR